MQTPCSHPRPSIFQETKMLNLSRRWTNTTMLAPKHPPESISSLRTIKSSLSRMASASRESLVSVRCMLFAPSIGTLHMNTRQLAQYLGSKRRLSKTTILNMTTYRSQSVPRHMFVVLRLKEGQKECWLRLDRRAEVPLNASLLFPTPAKDDVCHILFSFPCTSSDG